MSDLKPRDWDIEHSLWFIVSAACVCAYYAIFVLVCVLIYSENMSFSSFFIRRDVKHTEACESQMESCFSAPINHSEEAKKMAVNEKIRFKIKGYDHATVDIAAAKIVEAAKRSGA